MATIITSVVTGGSNNHATVSEEANSYATDFVNQGVLGSITNTSGVAPATGSFAVNQNTGSDMNVLISATGNTTSGYSTAYITCAPSSQDTQVLRGRMSSNYTYAINSNSTGSTVYDWIYLQANATNANTPSAAADNVITPYTSRSTSNSADNGSPPTYGILLAVVTVANGATGIANANIADKRTQITVSTGATNTTTGWTSLPYAFTYSANNGNKEFQVTTPNNLTGLLSPGMKLNFTRSVTPPTQCMAFSSASSQYASKSSPSGISFTSAFTCEAWVYLNSYVSNTPMIISRWDGTNGWFLGTTSTGNIQLNYSASSQNTTQQSYQSLPLNQWVHVAGVVSSVSSKTLAIYINGTLVPSSTVNSNTTTLTQGSAPLEVGGSNGANNFFNGYISEARVWSVARTQQNIQDNMAINLTGAESNLVFLAQGNGNFNDSTSNANNLTASGGAVATQASNPYNSIEYGVITSVSYSNPTSTITIFTGNSNTIPNQTLNTPEYSIVQIPYGFPAQKPNWRLESLYRTSTSVSASASTWTNPNAKLSIPIGYWMAGVSGETAATFSSGNPLVKATLSNANNTESDSRYTTSLHYTGGVTTTQLENTVFTRGGLVNTTQTAWYYNMWTSQSSPTFYVANDEANFIIYAECGYI